MPVTVAPVEERDVPPSVRLVGVIRPQRTTVVACEIAGLVARFPAEEGSYLRAGEIICELDPERPKLLLAEAQATLAGLQARLSELEAGERPEEVARLEALVAESQAVHDRWLWERRRAVELYEKNQGSAKERHDAEMDYQAAAGRLAQAKAQLEMARRGRPEVIARARQDLEAQRAIVGRLARDLEQTRVRAPFDGFVVAKRTEVGAWVDIGGPVCDFIALDAVKVRVDVPEQYVRFAHPGAPASLEVEALGASLQGPIARVIPQATAAARTFPVEIDVPNRDHALMAGMFVWAHVPSGPIGKRLLLSKDAIVQRGMARQVFVVRQTGEGPAMAVPVPVTTGLEVGHQVEVRSTELGAGDLVVIRANERLFGPSPVVPMPAGAAPPGGAAPQPPSTAPGAAPASAPSPTTQPHAATAAPGDPGVAMQPEAASADQPRAGAAPPTEALPPEGPPAGAASAGGP